MTSPYIVSVESLSTIVDEVTTSMIGRRTRPHSEAAGIPASERWTGVVQIGAPARLSVIIQCRKQLALFAATRMLGDDAATECAAKDVLGELTSMISGNVKSLIATLAGAPLGSPAVEVGDHGQGDPVLLEVHLRCGDEPLSVSLSERVLGVG